MLVKDWDFGNIIALIIFFSNLFVASIVIQFGFLMESRLFYNLICLTHCPSGSRHTRGHLWCTVQSVQWSSTLTYRIQCFRECYISDFNIRRVIVDLNYFGNKICFRSFQFEILNNEDTQTFWKFHDFLLKNYSCDWICVLQVFSLVFRIYVIRNNITNNPTDLWLPDY